jgi:hypothetical protein
MVSLFNFHSKIGQNSHALALLKNRHVSYTPLYIYIYIYIKQKKKKKKKKKSVTGATRQNWVAGHGLLLAQRHNTSGITSDSKSLIHLVEEIS